MKSEVRFMGPSFRVTMTIGLFATILIIFTAIWFTPLFLIGGIVVICLIAGYGFLRLYAGYQGLRVIKYQADKLQFERNVLVINRTQRALMPVNYSVKMIEATANQVTLLPETTTEITQSVDLLSALDNVQRCLIVGATDSGKTTLLQHIVYRRLQTSKVIVIDPHGYPNKWAGCSKVVGTGRDYIEIDKALTALVQIMTKRYDEIGRGVVAEMGHNRLTVLIDEWRAIVYQLGKPASEAIKALLTESRKAAFSVFVATHSDRAKPLGLEGEYDLKDGFAVVRLTIANGQRQATIDYGNGEQPATLPGQFVGNGQVIDTDFINLEIEPNQTEAAIINLFEQGQSISSIAAQIFGSKGGNQNQQVKNILQKYGVGV